MKRYITDALQVAAAIILTGGVLVSAAPIPQTTVLEPVETAQAEKVVNVPDEVEKTPEPIETKPETPKKPVIDPNNCEPERFWAKEPPHKCIDKPTQVKFASTVVTSRPTVSVGGNCDSWKAAAGIPNSYATNKLINNESGCDPSVYNKAGSGACGIPQALPCSKLTVDAGCTLDAAGAVCQLKWMDNYVKHRYTTWQGALNFWHCIGHCTSNIGTVYKTSNWY